jgi:hypothetical protein
MLKIRILAPEVFSRRVKSKTTGKEYLFRDQMGVVSIEGQLQPMKVSLAEDQAPYAVGEYEVLPASFYVDRDNKLAVGKLALQPIAAKPVDVTPARVVGAPLSARTGG